ncbi:hypothetical protein [Brachybacterium sp. AOP3-A1-3]|uniref:hypothetical protein n=1 Tax=Brachybacterium sp. AOP3-A1-3 TaxID=3457699 RepID=UPI00403497C4
MPVEMGLWRIDGDRPRRLPAATLPSEATLEDFLEHDPSLLGTPLLVIGRQVRTPYGKFIDLLAIDVDGNLHVLELKRDRSPRDVVAQVLDYGSWVTTLTREEVIDLANDHLEAPFEAAFADTFGDSLPDEVNVELQLTVVATELDSSSERIVNYLRDFGVPINAVFFSYLQDEDRHYLARSWLVSREEGPSLAVGSGRKSKRADWNGLDWFVAFGEEPGSRNWEDARHYGFISAGGGVWYSRTLRALPLGARVNVHIPESGYVGIGTVIGEAERFDRAKTTIEGEQVLLSDLQLAGRYSHGPGTEQEDDMAEWVVPVRWQTAVPREQAYWTKGMFANQNSACKLRQEFTLERLADHFGVEDA